MNSLFSSSLAKLGYPALLACTFACSTGNEQATDNPTATESAEIRAEIYSLADDAVLLEDLYATSVAVGQESSFSNALLDNDPATYWACKPGAGPDEGLMLYFAKPTYIKKLTLLQAKVKEAARLKLIEVYVNGSSVANGPVTQPISIDRSVRSLFIRFQSFMETQTRELSAEELRTINGTGLSAEQGYANIFPKNKFAAVAELTLQGRGNDTLKLVPPVFIPAEVKASSSLEPYAAYGVQQLFDGRKEIAWSEGAAGTGEGEVLSFSFTKPVNISGIKLSNGFQRSAEHFEANARAKMISLQSDSTEITLPLRDEMGAQTYSFDKPITSQQLKLVLTEAYPGKKYEDLVVSELSFRQGAISIKPVLTTKRELEEELQAQAKGTVLENVLNRSVNVQQGEYDFDAERSFILRSDYTFVYYKKESLYEGNGNTDEEIVADGNWELKHVSSDSVVVRVFGKLASVSKRAEFYVGNTEESQTRIFQDFVTITPERIAGQRFIDAIGIYE